MFTIINNTPNQWQAQTGDQSSGPVFPFDLTGNLSPVSQMGNSGADTLYLYIDPSSLTMSTPRIRRNAAVTFAVLVQTTGTISD